MFFHMRRRNVGLVAVAGSLQVLMLVRVETSNGTSVGVSSARFALDRVLELSTLCSALFYADYGLVQKFARQKSHVPLGEYE